MNDTKNNNIEVTEDAGEDSDVDICDEFELKRNFKKNYTICAEKSISLNNNYILHMDYKDEKVCMGLSNNEVEVHELKNNEIAKLCKFDEHRNCIVDVKFSTEDNLVYTGSMDGSVRLWDLRTPQKSVHIFTDTSSSEVSKPFSCFDVSCNNRVICAGTELYEGDSFLIFWDIRNTKLLGGYWESHMDDITKVAFHPINKDIIASCSTDGLINIFHLSKASEDDALECSLNTESSVEQILWYTYNNEDAIASVTHPSHVQLWLVEEGNHYARFTRENLSKEMKRKSPEHCYIANMHTDSTRENLFLLTGSNWHNGECVRGLCIDDNKISPCFMLEGNKQRIRCSYYDAENEFLITGGESGIVSVWKEGEESSSKTLKSKSKSKLHMKKPY